MRGLKFLRVATPLAIAAVAAVAGLSVSGGSDASALVRYKVCTVADYGWCNVNEEHSYIDVATGQNNFAGNPGTEYGFWCSRLYNADTNTYHAKKCGYARAVTTCYRGGGIHMRGNGQNGDNWGKQTIIVYARTASDSYSC